MRRAVALLALLLTGCGVRPDAAPQGLDPSVAPTEVAGSPVPRPATVDVYLVRDSALVRVRRVVVAPATAAQRLGALLPGPDEREKAAGLRTEVARRLAVSVRGGVATVEGPPGDVLAVAQVVLTLTESAEVTAVRFAEPVPLPDGSVRAEVTRADYAALAG